jgi:CRP/FNR family transcriptional regulator
MESGTLGRTYQDQEPVVVQGEVGNCMYVIQQGEVEVVKERAGQDMILAVLKEGDFFGEMAIFEREVRSATVRARGTAKVMTVDKKTLLRRIQEDPSLAFNILKTMSQRIRQLNSQLIQGSSELSQTENPD